MVFVLNQWAEVVHVGLPSTKSVDPIKNKLQSAQNGLTKNKHQWALWVPRYNLGDAGRKTSGPPSWDIKEEIYQARQKIWAQLVIRASLSGSRQIGHSSQSSMACASISCSLIFSAGVMAMGFAALLSFASAVRSSSR